MKLHWIEVTVEATPEASEAVANILIEEGAGGVVESSPAARTAYYPEVGDWQARVDRIRQRVAGLSRFGLDPGPARVAWRRVNDEDWAEAWKAHFHPVRLGRRIVVRPTWRAYVPEPGDVVIDLDPGMAFGTGSHPTTALCAAALEERVSPGCTVCDVGTGSGILAIAAARLGASCVLACDTDPLAVCIAKENAARNGVAERITTVDGSWPELIALGRRAEVVVANIIAPVIMSMARDARKLAKPGGVFIASGIVAERAGEVAAALEEAGWLPAGRLEREGWIALLARNGDAP